MSDPQQHVKPRLKLPPGGPVSECEQNLVVIGANGSGKSRLGVWLENNNSPTHRVSAQRALRFEESIALRPLDAAEKEWMYGNRQYSQPSQRLNGRWAQHPTNHVLADFDALLATLFARQRERNREHSDAIQKLVTDQASAAGSNAAAGTPIAIENLRRRPCELDQIASLWRELFPHRELLLGSDAVKAKTSGGAEYNGRDMSDGERVAFYLCGQVLCLPPQSIVVLDEPELHLHRSLLTRLFNALEDLRGDCLFVYITHDVDFATTRVGALKLWPKQWDGSAWTWDIVAGAEGLPEALLLSLLGSRKPVLFTEGETGSLDQRLFSLVYAAHYVVPRGSCEKAVEATKAHRATPQLSHTAANGIIDRDRMSDARVSKLRERGVEVLDVAEVENLFLLEDVVSFMAGYLQRDRAAAVRAVKQMVFNALAGELAVQAWERAEARLREALEGLEAGDKSRAGLVGAFVGLTSALDVGQLFDAEHNALEQAVQREDYETVLRLYNRKSLARRAAPLLGLSNRDDAYPELVLGLLRASGDQSQQLRAIFQRHLPRLQQ